MIVVLTGMWCDLLKVTISRCNSLGMLTEVLWYLPFAESVVLISYELSYLVGSENRCGFEVQGCKVQVLVKGICLFHFFHFGMDLFDLFFSHRCVG